jgi:hypothetical protein
MRIYLFGLRLTVLSLVVLMGLAGCREEKATTADEEASGYVMSLDVEPDPPTVGEATLIFTIREEQGPLIGDASVKVQGDMNHAGMQPVFGEVDSSIDGLYRIPFEWTMAGEWILTVTVTFADGSDTQATFDLSVGADGEMDMDMAATEEG